MRSLSRSVAMFLLPLILSACAENTYDRIETGGTARTDVRLDPSLPVMISSVKDGIFAGKPAAHSGTVVARTIDASLSRYAKIVDVSPTEYQKPVAAQQTNPYADYAYIVVPTIVAWNIPDPEHDHFPVTLKVKVTVLDAGTGEKISSNFLEASAPSPQSFGSFINRDSEKPTDMLSELVDDYVDELYGHAFWPL